MYLDGVGVRDAQSWCSSAVQRLHHDLQRPTHTDLRPADRAPQSPQQTGGVSYLERVVGHVTDADDIIGIGEHPSKPDIQKTNR